MYSVLLSNTIPSKTPRSCSARLKHACHHENRPLIINSHHHKLIGRRRKKKIVNSPLIRSRSLQDISTRFKPAPSPTNSHKSILYQPRQSHQKPLITRGVRCLSISVDLIPENVVPDHPESRIKPLSGDGFRYCKAIFGSRRLRFNLFGKSTYFGTSDRSCHRTTLRGPGSLTSSTCGFLRDVILIASNYCPASTVNRR